MNQYANNQPKDNEFDEKVIQISRVSKKTKGGNKMGFSILMVVGDRKGRVGVGLGKAGDVLSAMRKGVKKAKKKMITVPLDGTTVPFSIKVKQGAAYIMLKPAPKGSGVIAGGPIRAVVDAAGIRDISSKILGTTNKASNVYATFEALKQIEAIVKLKNIPLKSIAEIEAEEAKKVAELQKQAKSKGEAALEKEKADQAARTVKASNNLKAPKAKPAHKPSAKAAAAKSASKEKEVKAETK
jgi:small subunit ribosomal protein S5